MGATHEPPSPLCPTHRNFNGTIPKCGRCGDARKAFQAWERDEVSRKRRANETAAKAMRDCIHCDEFGWLLGEDRKPVEPATRCIVHEFRNEATA